MNAAARHRARAAQKGFWRSVLVNLPGGDVEAHVYPIFPGEREHVEAATCWCNPKRDEDDARLIVHDREVPR